MRFASILIAILLFLQSDVIDSTDTFYQFTELEPSTTYYVLIYSTVNRPNGQEPQRSDVVQVEITTKAPSNSK